MSVEGNRDHAVMWKVAKENQAVKLAGDLAMFQFGEESHETLVACHYPLEVWPQKEFGFVHMHGHTHARGKNMVSEGRLDVSVDNLMKVFNRPIVKLAEALEYLKEMEES